MYAGAIILAALAGFLSAITALLLGLNGWAALAVYSGTGIATLAAVLAAAQIRPLFARLAGLLAHRAAALRSFAIK